MPKSENFPSLKPEGKIETKQEIIDQFLEMDPKEQERILEIVAEGVNLSLLFRRMAEDPQGQKAIEALKRLRNNSIVSLLDVVPLKGGLFSFGADALKIKFLRRILNKALKHWDIKVDDLTPDVPKIIAWGTELLEIPFLGTAPTHAIEGSLQALADVPKFWRGLKTLKRIKEEERNKIEKFRPIIKKARDVFNKK